MAFPFWLFNDNNWGNTALRSNQIISTLPGQFYTEASIVKPYQKIRFDKGMFVLFLVLQCLVMCILWGVMVWVWVSGNGSVKTSSFPLFDIAFKAKIENERTDTNLQKSDSREVIKFVRGSRLVPKIDA